MSEDEVELWTVTSPSGSDLHLRTEEEADYYESRRDRYQTDNAFPNVSDLQDLDRLLVFEVMTYRWSLWMSQGFDYDQMRVDEGALKRMVEDYSKEIRFLKASLGIDKATRDKEKGENLAEYMEKLLQRAKAFGYHRNEQYAKAVTLIFELRSKVQTMDRSNEDERQTLGLSPDTIIDWIRTEMVDQWDAIDAQFRTAQAMWIRDM